MHPMLPYHTLPKEAYTPIQPLHNNYVIQQPTHTHTKVHIMISLFIVKLGITIFSTLMFFFATFFILYYLDKRLGATFTESFSTIKKCPRSLATYLATRYAATTIAMGLIVCLVFLT